MAYAERIVFRLSRGIAWVAGGALAGITILVIGNILLRIVWRPILGTYELVSFFGGMFVFLGLAYCAAEKGNIAIGVLVERFSPRAQAICGSITTILGLFISAIMAWQCVVFATDMWHRGYVSEVLQIPVSPFIYAGAIGFGMLCLVLLVELSKSLAKVVTK